MPGGSVPSSFQPLAVYISTPHSPRNGYLSRPLPFYPT